MVFVNCPLVYRSCAMHALIGLKDLQHHQQVYQTKEGESAGELPANARFAHVKFSDPLAVKSVLDAPNSKISISMCKSNLTPFSLVYRYV